MATSRSKGNQDVVPLPLNLLDHRFVDVLLQFANQQEVANRGRVIAKAVQQVPLDFK